MIAELHDGTQLEFPDGTDPTVVQSTVKKVLEQKRIERFQTQLEADRKLYSPTNGMNGGELMRAAIGGGMTDLARGAGQWLGLVSRDDIKEARRLDAPLDATPEGKIGRFIGKAAPLAAGSLALPAMSTLGGAAAFGGASGALEPSESTSETLLNIGVGTAAGAAGQWGGNKLADWLAKRATGKAAEFATQQAANAQKLSAAREASKAGYVIPPSDIQPQGRIMEAIGGLSGKVKTAQVASAKNQAVTDRLAKQALGMAPDAPLDTAVLDGIRQQAGQAYKAVSSTGTVVPGSAYAQSLDDAIQPFVSQAKSFPSRKVPEVVNDISALKTQSFDAGDAVETIKILRNDADVAYRTGDNLSGKAYKKAAEAIEQALDDHINAIGAPADLVKGYRSARELIAKTYTVQKAMNSQTGEVSAQALAKELGRGKPLSAELRQIAKVGQAFPKATQALKEAPKALSPLDWAMAGMSAAGTGGNPLSAAGLLARPGVRSLLLSQGVQSSAMKSAKPPVSALSNVTNAELMRLLYGPVTASGGLAAVNGLQQ